MPAGSATPAGTVLLNSPDSLQGLAVAAEGYRFVDWSGDLSGSKNPQSITIDKPRSTTANFVAVAPFPWQWVVIGIAGASLIAFLAYFLRGELSKR